MNVSTTAGARKAHVYGVPDPEAGAELRLIEAMQPFRGLVLASALQALFGSGLYDRLENREVAVDDLARELALDGYRTRTLMRFLAVEGIVVVSGDAPDDVVALTGRARAFGEFRAWYEMLVGGYADVLAGLTAALAEGSPLPARAGAHVAAGSAGVSLYCSMPMVRRLVRRLPAPPRLILDVGCGSPEYVFRICDEHGARGIGVEPDEDALRAGAEILRRLDAEDVVSLVHGAAQDCLQRLDAQPDLALTAFVLHEVLGQSGEGGVRRYLRDLFDAVPDAHLLAIEVDWQQQDPSRMQHGYARNYYNGYYLLHPFTEQRLATRAYWEELFAAESLEIVAADTTDADVDSTRLELGWLLRRVG